METSSHPTEDTHTIIRMIDGSSYCIDCREEI
jgi:hypothetical protein